MQRSAADFKKQLYGRHKREKSSDKNTKENKLERPLISSLIAELEKEDIRLKPLESKVVLSELKP